MRPLRCLLDELLLPRFTRSLLSCITLDVLFFRTQPSPGAECGRVPAYSRCDHSMVARPASTDPCDRSTRETKSRDYIHTGRLLTLSGSRSDRGARVLAAPRQHRLSRLMMRKYRRLTRRPDSTRTSYSCLRNARPIRMASCSRNSYMRSIALSSSSSSSSLVQYVSFRMP
jgi:hypothetical protein